MKNIFKVFVAVLLAIGVCGVVYAEAPASDAVQFFGPNGAVGLTPTTVIVPVRYAKEGDINPSLASGDVVVWDVTSADGFTISACETSNDTTFAGILVTSIQTADSTVFRRNSRNWGYMCVKGYCLAKMDAATTAGELLVPSGDAADGEASMTTADKWASFYRNNYMSMDIGVALKTTTTSELAPVWLK